MFFVRGDGCDKSDKPSGADIGCPLWELDFYPNDQLPGTDWTNRGTKWDTCGTAHDASSGKRSERFFRTDHLACFPSRPTADTPSLRVRERGRRACHRQTLKSCAGADAFFRRCK